MSDAGRIIRLGARGSLLSRMQSQVVATMVEAANPGVKVELVTFKTSGDQIADRPLHEIGGKGLFTLELERALLSGQIDFAVHSFKDVPVTMPLVEQGELVVAAVPKREDARDALVNRIARRIGELPMGAKVGTGSLRRTAQLLHLRPDLNVTMIRGNVDTRLRKLREGEFDAIILAMAGLRRANLYDEREMMPIDGDQMLPAAGQGALSVQCRRDALPVRDMLANLDDGQTRRCVELERAVVAALDGDCHSPIAAWAKELDGKMMLEAAVGGRDGRPPVVRARASGGKEGDQTLVDQVVAQLRENGAVELLLGESEA